MGSEEGSLHDEKWLLDQHFFVFFRVAVKFCNVGSNLFDYFNTGHFRHLEVYQNQGDWLNRYGILRPLATCILHVHLIALLNLFRDNLDTVMPVEAEQALLNETKRL